MLIDFHAHILPGLDHGCAGLLMAQEQWRLMEAAGVSAVVATSHYYSQSQGISDFLAARQRALDCLAPVTAGSRLRLIPAAEVLVTPGLYHLADLGRLCIGDTPYILLEFPFSSWNAELVETVDRIADRGMIPILAHIDRYKPADREIALGRNWYVQLNSASICGYFDFRYWLPWLRSGRVVAIGSDLHGVDAHYNRFPLAAKRVMRHCPGVFDAARRILGL